MQNVEELIAREGWDWHTIPDCDGTTDYVVTTPHGCFYGPRLLAAYLLANLSHTRNNA